MKIGRSVLFTQKNLIKSKLNQFCTPFNLKYSMKFKFHFLKIKSIIFTARGFNLNLSFTTLNKRHSYLISSIPLIFRDGQTVYSQCEMYSRNYTEILMMLHTMDTQKLRNKTELYLDPLNSTTRNYESVKCKDGWIYNRTMFPNTVVMEVYSNCRLHCNL